ncbi:NADH dehydrogenase [ubiquinone] 1 alpha subcomplex assembly factor 4 [Pelodytes ibericus]
MGARITRVVKNFNLENRTHRLIGKDKPRAAPLHPSTEEAHRSLLAKHPDIQETVYKKDDQLLSRLKDVYVDSTDPSHEVKNEVSHPSEQEEHRLPKLTMRSVPFDLLNVNSIPNGKISIMEALLVLSNHKRFPDTWTAEKIAKDYNLEIKDSQALLEYFIPFDVKIIPPKDTKEITER